MILGSTKNESELPGVVGRQALRRQAGRMVEPVGNILVGAAAACGLYARRDLQPVGFVRRRFEYQAQPVSDRQAGRHPPGVLPVELIVVDRVTALDCRALGQRVAVAGEIVDAVPLGKNSQQDRGRAVVVGTEAGIYRWIAVVGRVQRAGGIGDYARVKIDGVGLNVGVRVGV